MNPGYKSNQSSSFRKKTAESAVRRNFEKMYLPNTSYPMFDATDGGNLEKVGAYLFLFMLFLSTSTNYYISLIFMLIIMCSISSALRRSGSLYSGRWARLLSLTPQPLFASCSLCRTNPTVSIVRYNDLFWVTVRGGGWMMGAYTLCLFNGHCYHNQPTIHIKGYVIREVEWMMHYSMFCPLWHASFCYDSYAYNTHWHSTTFCSHCAGRFDDLESVLSCLSLSSKVVRRKVRNIHLYAVSGL